MSRFGSGDDGEAPVGGSLIPALCGMLVRASIKVQQWAAATLLPTPSRPHYQFTLNDLARVFQGMLRYASCTKDVLVVLRTALMF